MRLKRALDHPVVLVVLIAIAIGGAGLLYDTVRGPSGEATGLADTAWPMFQQDPQHTGRSVSTMPTRLALDWRAKLNGLPGGPAIGTDGTIYVPTGGDWDKQSGSLYSINPDGTQNWRFQFPEPSNPGDCRQVAAYATPAIADDGTIYVHTQGNYTPGGAQCQIGPDGYLFAVDPDDGSEKWRFQVGGEGGGPPLSSPAVGPDGTVYVTTSSGELFAIDPAGTLDWSDVPDPLLTALQSSPAVAPDGTVYVSSFDLYAYEPDGTPKWTANLGGAAPNPTSPSVGSDGTVYACFLAPDACHAVSPEGDDLWSFPYKAGSSTPAIGTDGAIYIAGRDASSHGYLTALESNGGIRWQRDFPNPLTPSIPASGIGTPVIDGSGKLLTRVNIDATELSQFVDLLFVLASTSAELDRREVTEGGLAGDVTPAIATDGTVYAPDPNAHWEPDYDPDSQYLAAYVQGARLKVTVSGSWRGEVKGPGIDCSDGSQHRDCSEVYVKGESVTLTATTDAGGEFVGWGGDCSGIGSCTLTMDADRNVTATINRKPGTPDLDDVAPSPGLGPGTEDGGGTSPDPQAAIKRCKKKYPKGKKRTKCIKKARKQAG